MLAVISRWSRTARAIERWPVPVGRDAIVFFCVSMSLLLVRSFPPSIQHGVPELRVMNDRIWRVRLQANRQTSHFARGWMDVTGHLWSVFVSFFISFLTVRGQFFASLLLSVTRYIEDMLSMACSRRNAKKTYTPSRSSPPPSQLVH